MRMLTGIQASGTLHLGNYFGAMKPMIDYQDDNELFTFIANYHSLTTSKDAQSLRKYTIEAAIDYLALGLNPEKTTFYIQSSAPEVLELYFILSKFTPMGLLERGHSYKDKVNNGISPSHALFSYPVLMAADILLLDTEKVPVGKDQIQHVEMTRDIATKFNNEYGEILTLPEYIVQENVQTVPGIDGRKMSKSYGNAIDIFMDSKSLQKRCNKIESSSIPMGEPLPYENDNIFQLASLFLNDQEKIALQNRYMSGKEGYGHFKQYLHSLIRNEFGEANEKREYYLSHMDEVKDILSDGAKKVRVIANKKMEIVRDAIGLY